MELESPIVDSIGLLIAVVLLSAVASMAAPLIASPALWLVLFQLVCVAAPVAVFAVIRRGTLSAAIERPRVSQLLVAIAMGAALAAANIGLVIPLSPLTAPSTSTVARAVPSLALPVALIAMAIVPAIAEELLFRGIVLRALARRHRAFALVVSSLLFAAFHMSVPGLVPLFVVGLVAGATVLISGNVVLAIVVHASNNAAVLVLIRTTWNDGPGLVGGACAVVAIGVLLSGLSRLGGGLR